MRSDRRALVVGLQSYERLGALRYANDDAIAISRELSDYNCQFSCTLLIDEQASAQNIRDHFKNLFVGADDNATIIFFYAGHGVTQDDGTFLITLDTEHDLEAGVSFSRLIEIVRSQSQKKPHLNCVFLLDCCHAGAMAQYNSSQKPVLKTNILGTGPILGQIRKRYS